MATWASEESAGTESDAAHSVGKPPSSAAGDRQLFCIRVWTTPSTLEACFLEVPTRPIQSCTLSAGTSLFSGATTSVHANPWVDRADKWGQAQPAAFQHRQDARGGSKGSREVCILGRRVAERGRRGWNVLNLDPDAGDIQVHMLIFHGVTRVWVLRGYLYHSSVFKKKQQHRETNGSG